MGAYQFPIEDLKGQDENSASVIEDHKGIHWVQKTSAIKQTSGTKTICELFKE